MPAHTQADARNFSCLNTPGVAAPACALPFLSLVTDDFQVLHLNVRRTHLLGVFISASELASRLVACVLRLQTRRNAQSGLVRCMKVTRGQFASREEVKLKNQMRFYRQREQYRQHRALTITEHPFIHAQLIFSLVGSPLSRSATFSLGAHCVSAVEAAAPTANQESSTQ